MLDRRAVVKTLLARRGDLLVVCGLGSPTWDVAAAGDDPRNLYLWGAMGGAAMIGLGLALARPERRVLVVTGDGEMLMGMGALATIAVQRPANLAIVVLDNGAFGETGMQESHTARGVDLAAVAAACGFADTRVIATMADLEAARTALHEAAEGPRLFVLKIGPENPPRSLPPRDAVHLKNRLRAHLGLPLP